MYESECEEKLEAAVLIIKNISKCPNCETCSTLARTGLEVLVDWPSPTTQTVVKSLVKS